MPFANDCDRHKNSTGTGPNLHALKACSFISSLCPNLSYFCPTLNNAERGLRADHHAVLILATALWFQLYRQQRCDKTAPAASSFHDFTNSFPI